LQLRFTRRRSRSGLLRKARQRHEYYQRRESDWGAHAARVHFTAGRRKACVWRAAKHDRPAGCAPRNFDAAQCEHTKFLQLRESDLLGLELLRDVASPSSHSSFCEEVFSLRIRETNEVDRTNILAPGL